MVSSNVASSSSSSSGVGVLHGSDSFDAVSKDVFSSSLESTKRAFGTSFFPQYAGILLASHCLRVGTFVCKLLRPRDAVDGAVHGIRRVKLEKLVFGRSLVAVNLDLS